MAIVSSKAPIKDLSGTIGNQLVFKKYGNKTVVSMKPSPRKTNSPLQQRNLDKFKEAARYARTILRDPIKSEAYRKLARKLNKHSAWNVAISEYMLTIRIDAKPGEQPTKTGKRITLTATKKSFKVKDVAITVQSASGETLAIGPATRINTTDWVYNMPLLPDGDVLLVITARDGLGLATTKRLWL